MKKVGDKFSLTINIDEVEIIREDKFTYTVEFQGINGRTTLLVDKKEMNKCEVKNANSE